MKLLAALGINNLFFAYLQLTNEFYPINFYIKCFILLYYVQKEIQMDDTITSESKTGKRLKNIKHYDILKLSYKGKYIPIISIITIGRDKKSTIKINDNMTSRKHALIQKIKNNFFIKDLDSTNGTYVNNEKIPHNKYIKLHKKDILRIGRTEIIII